MNNRQDKNIFTRRVFIFSIVKVFLGLLILSRLSYLQLFKAAHYKLLSDKNRLVSKLTLPNRGKILDSNGNYIAKNRYTYSAYLDLFEIPEEKKEEVVNIILDDKDIEESVKDSLHNLPKRITKSNRYILLQEDLSWDTLAGYYILATKIPGIVIEKIQTRYYLYSEEFSHIIGYTGSPTKEDIANSENNAFSLPLAKIGKTGFEKQYNDDLFGKSGIKHIEINAKMEFVRDIDNIDSVPGADINLTINRDLQLEVYKIMSAQESGSCVVMDIHTGAILSYVSYPGYDINIFTKKIDPKVLKSIYENPYKPMINKVINGLYSPGSVFKMMTGLTALKKGVINKHTMFDCQGFYELGNHKFHCWKWKYGGHGAMNLQNALAESCDVYFYNLAKLLSPDDISKTANDFGLGLLTNIDLPNEKSGLIPTKAWKKDKKKQRWTLGDSFNMSIGQGFVLCTPIQLAKMISILVNGLKPITPHLRKSKELITPERLNYKPEHIQIILDGMYDVVNSYSGTARKSAIEDENFEFGGKTGSSQVFRITEKLRREGKTVSDDYWKKEHAVFVGYAPADNPKIAVSVLIEHGGGGSHTAAPIARDVLLAAKKHLSL